MKSFVCVVFIVALLAKDALCGVTFATNSNPTTFVTQLQTPYSNDDFSTADPGDDYESVLNGYEYTIYSYDTADDEADLDSGIIPIYTSTGTILIQSGGYAKNDYLYFDFTGSPKKVNVVGGYVFLSNSKGQVQTGTLTAYVNGVAVGTITSTAGSNPSYVTLIDDGTISNVYFEAPTATGKVYVTVYSFIVGELEGSVVADPHFIGFDGAKYDIVGAPGKIFNLISQPHIQINARFNKPCEDSSKNQDIIDELGVLINGHQIFFDLFHTATVDGVVIQAHHIKYPIGDESSTIEWTWPHMYELVTPSLNFSVVQNLGDNKDIKGTKNCLGGWMDSYYHSIDETVPTHGLLGQTINFSEGKETDDEGTGIIEGVYTDYIVSSLFTADFKYNQYTDQAAK